jgi:hypothetical protein
VRADRFFSAAPEVRKTLEERVARNAAQLARDGAPRKTFYLTGRVGDEGIALHGEDGKVILTREGGGREEVDLEATGGRAHPGEPAALPPPSLAGPSGQPGEEPDDTTSAEESRTEEEVTESPATGEER